MSKAKVAFFYIFLLVSLVNTVLMYSQTSMFTIQTFSAALFTMIVLISSGLLTLIALKNKRRMVKKASYRIELVSLLVLVLMSVVSRVNEALIGVYDTSFIWRLGATLLYLVLFLFAIGLSRDLFKTLLSIHNKKNNHNFQKS